jgi:hypothetical protein
MKKEEIYVVIDSEQTRQRAIEILERAGEIIDYSNFELSDILIVHSIDKDWFLTEEHFKKSKQEITLDQLEQMLLPKQGYICPQTKIQCDDECCVSAEDCHITSSLDSGIVDCEPKQEIKMELDALKLIAESYGFKLVEKPREIKVGDFGKFWDNDNKDCCFGFLHTIDNDLGSFDLGSFESGAGLYWSKFHHLTDEEKQQIQENW